MRTECVSLFYILLRSSSCSFTRLNLIKPYLLGILDTIGPLGGTQGGTQAIYWYRELTLCIFKLQQLQVPLDLGLNSPVTGSSLYMYVHTHVNILNIFTSSLAIGSPNIPTLLY